MRIYVFEICKDRHSDWEKTFLKETIVLVWC